MRRRAALAPASPTRCNDAVEPEERFSALVDEFAERPGVAVPDRSRRRGFGSSTLRVGGSIFAMLVGERLVVKLPRARVDALIEGGVGDPYDGGRGRPMKEWVAVAVEDPQTWVSLAGEAMEFVGSSARSG